MVLMPFALYDEIIYHLLLFVWGLKHCPFTQVHCLSQEMFLLSSVGFLCNVTQPFIKSMVRWCQPWWGGVTLFWVTIISSCFEPRLVRANSQSVIDAWSGTKTNNFCSFFSKSYLSCPIGGAAAQANELKLRIETCVLRHLQRSKFTAPQNGILIISPQEEMAKPQALSWV